MTDHRSIAVALLIIFATFIYYFGFRMSSIRQKCSGEALEYSLSQNWTAEKGTEEGIKKALDRKQLYNASFEVCLHSNGLGE